MYHAETTEERPQAHKHSDLCPLCKRHHNDRVVAIPELPNHQYWPGADEVAEWVANEDGYQELLACIARGEGKQADALRFWPVLLAGDAESAYVLIVPPGTTGPVLVIGAITWRAQARIACKGDPVAWAHDQRWVSMPAHRCVEPDGTLRYGYGS